MKKLDIGVIVATLIIVTISCSLAFFAARVVGEPKSFNLTAKDLSIAFNDTSSITDSLITPGWNTTKTFTITNNSKEEYKYNISIKDLVNTFTSTGALQYKITSTNNGYNMTEYKDIPKSDTATDTILAYSVSIPVGVTQTYTIEFTYLNGEEVDQSEDMGKTLSGTLFITEGTEPTFYSTLLLDRGIATTNRTTFSSVFDSTDQVLYTATENGTTVYYFAGNVTTNWVKFGKNSSGNDLYWRIIRTNSDGGVRLLYHGTSTTAEDAYIGISAFNSSSDNIAYVSYMYGSLGSVANARENTTDSTIKGVIDTWYKDNLNTNYGKYISTTAVYCNDRTYIVNGSYTYFGGFTRVYLYKTPTYDCTETDDKFTVDSSTGNGKLTYPIALMTADEVNYAGGVNATNNANAWYFRNAKEGTLTTSSSTYTSYSSTGSTYWWLLSPLNWDSSARVFIVGNADQPGSLKHNPVASTNGVRPVISLNSCIKYSTGNGSADDPYTIQETSTGC